MWWKTVPEVGARNWKSPFADGGENEWRYYKFVKGSRPQSMPVQYISDTLTRVKYDDRYADVLEQTMN